jgi:hypothetical protein
MSQGALSQWATTTLFGGGCPGQAVPICAQLMGNTAAINSNSLYMITFSTNKNLSKNMAFYNVVLLQIFDSIIADKGIFFVHILYKIS